MEQILRNIIEEHFPEIKKDLMVSILFWVMVYNYTKLSKVHQTEQLRYMHFIICFTVGKNLCIENLELYWKSTLLLANTEPEPIPRHTLVI